MKNIMIMSAIVLLVSVNMAYAGPEHVVAKYNALIIEGTLERHVVSDLMLMPVGNMYVNMDETIAIGGKGSIVCLVLDGATLNPGYSVVSTFTFFSAIDNIRSVSDAGALYFKKFDAALKRHISSNGAEQKFNIKNGEISITTSESRHLVITAKIKGI